MSRAVSEKTGRGVYKSAERGRDVKCRIPRRWSPGKTTRPVAAGPAAGAAKPAVRSSHDSYSTVSRNSSYRSGGNPTRSRSQDERMDISKRAGTIVVQPDVIVKTDKIKWKSDYKHLSSKTSSISVSLKLENSQESITATPDETSLRLLQNPLTEKQINFDKLNSELNSKQKLLTEAFTEMKTTKHHVKSLGGDSVTPDVPSYEESLMVPAPTENMSIAAPRNLSENLINLPCGLIKCCETAITGQKEIVQWINSLLTSKDKGIRLQDLANKVTEFTNTYKSTASYLGAARTCFDNELSQTADILRLRQEEHEHLLRKMQHLKIEMEELKTQNVDMQRQLLSSSDHVNCVPPVKTKIEELEKDLKAEKCKRSIVREQLTRAETQMNSSAEQVAELKTHLEEARGEVQALKTAVQQLQEQNLKMQMEHDSDNKKMAEFVREKTEYVKNMHKDREILEDEKIDLERRLGEVEFQYRDKITQMEHELNKIKAQSDDVDAQRKELAEINLKVKEELEAIRAQAADIEERYNKLLEEKARDNESQIKSTEIIKKYELEIELLRHKVNESQEIINELKICEERHQELKGTLSKDLQRKEQSIMEIKNELMTELRGKNDCISDLKKKVEEMEEEIQESEVKVELYEHQLQNLKNNLGYVTYDDEGDTMACFEGLRNLINEQRTKLLEATRQNGELADELQRKEDESKLHENTIKTQLAAIARSDEIIEILSKKDEEQINAIAMLRNDLTIKIEAELNANRNLAQKSEEISILLRSVEKRKQEIHQLEQIILTLEDQSSKMKVVKKTQQEKISILERKISENQERKNKMNVPAEYLDNLISILEAELGNSDHDELRNMGDESFGQVKNRKTGRLDSRALSPTKNKRLYDDSDLESALDNKTWNRPSSSGILEKANESAYLSDDSIRSRDLNRYGIDNCEWISNRQNNINVYHTLRTDIALNNSGGGAGAVCRRCKARSPVRTVQVPRASKGDLGLRAPRAPRHHH